MTKAAVASMDASTTSARNADQAESFAGVTWTAVLVFPVSRAVRPVVDVDESKATARGRTVGHLKATGSREESTRHRL